MRQKHPVTVFIDSNVYDVGLENPITNSFIVLRMALQRKIVPVAAILTVKEVGGYFRQSYGRNTGWLVEQFIRNLPNLIIEDEAKLKAETKANQRRYKLEKEDASLLAVAKRQKADYFISLNRHFLKSRIQKPHVLSPKDFCKRMQIQPITDFE